MVTRSHALTGSAGVYFVAAQISALGFHAALTMHNVPNIDLVASKLNGSHSVGIQVKTSTLANRKSGDGENRSIVQYQWDMSENAWNAALVKGTELLFAFVDLNCDQGTALEEVPEVFVVPCSFLRKYYRGVVRRSFGGDALKWKRKRIHVAASEFNQFKNNWAILRASLR